MLRKGEVISATSFFDGKSFTVRLLSSRPVAEGGTAKIFVGRTETADPIGQSSRGLVALKWFVTNMAEFQQQLLNRELRAVRQVRHPHILPYLGTAVFEYNKILIAEYMRNGNLLQYLKRKPGLDRRPLLVQVATAVDFLHVEHGLIHGDLKCENVLVADDGRTRLADFGLSTIIEKTDTSTRTATALRQQATIQFAAPELFFGEPDPLAAEESGRPVRRTPWTDVYAFGMLVVQAFTGRPPWSGFTSTEILMKLHLRITHPRPDSTVPPLGISDTWWDACLSCWKYDPSERPTMRELLLKLEDIQDIVEEPCTTSLTMSVNAGASGDEHGAEGTYGLVCVVPAIHNAFSGVQTPAVPHRGRLRSQTPNEKRTRRWGVYLGDGVSSIRDAGDGSLSDTGGFHGSVDRLIPSTQPRFPARITPARLRSSSVPAVPSRAVQVSAPGKERSRGSASRDSDDSDDPVRLSPPAISVLESRSLPGGGQVDGSAARNASPGVVPFVARKPKAHLPREPQAWHSRPQAHTFAPRQEGQVIPAARPILPQRKRVMPWDWLEPEWLRRTLGD